MSPCVPYCARGSPRALPEAEIPHWELALYLPLSSRALPRRCNCIRKMKWRTAQPCSCSNCLSRALSASGTLHAAALAEIKRGKGSPHLSLFPKGFFLLKPLCLQMQLIKLCYGVCHPGLCTCGSREDQLEKSGAGSSWSIPCISPVLMRGPPFLEGLVLSPDPLNYPEVFRGKCHLQTHMWAVSSTHE